jgi:hypothetical protein
MRRVKQTKVLHGLGDSTLPVDQEVNAILVRSISTEKFVQMSQELSSHFLDLVQDALLKSFWRRRALLAFLRRHRISENFLAAWDNSETKRDFLARLFPKLESIQKGPVVIMKMADSLAEQVRFPDLEGWEDSADKIKAATEAVGSLKDYLEQEKQTADELKEREEIKRIAREKREKEITKKQSLEKLSTRLTELSKRLGAQTAGYEFQDWFYDLIQYFEVVARRPYTTAGRQIDGSVTIEGTTYLTELKFTSEQAAVTDIDSLLAKLNDKADNTMAIIVSISGYSSTAIAGASGRKTPIVLMDYNHLFLLLNGGWKFDELVSRLRRHASQTGQAFLPASELS